MAKPHVALCCCSDVMIPPGNGLGDIINLRFAIACTFEDCGVTIWHDVAELVQYLMGFDKIITFNGEKFDFPLIAAELTRVLYEGETLDHNAISLSEEFTQTCDELLKKSFDLMVVTKAQTGSIVSLANLAKSTLKFERQHSIQTGTAALDSGNVIGAVNFVLEGATLCYNLHYVAAHQHQLAMEGPDERITIFDL